MLDVLEKCLISDCHGAVKGFLDIDPANCSQEIRSRGGTISGDRDTGGKEGYEEGTVVRLDKIESDMYRVHFLLNTGFIQLVKEVPSRLPFLIPDKGWAVCTPTKLHQRVSRLEVLDKVLFKVDTDSMPSAQSRGSLKQRINSSMFDQSDFNTNNVIFPSIPTAAVSQPSNDSATEHVTRDRRELKEKLMSHIVSSTVDNTPIKEETVMTSKMKRSIPGDFRSSVEAGRTGKHGLTDPNDSTVSRESVLQTDSSMNGGGGVCDVTSTRNTPVRAPATHPATPQSWYSHRGYNAPHHRERGGEGSSSGGRHYPDYQQQLHPAFHLHTVDHTPTNNDHNDHDPDLTPVNSRDNLYLSREQSAHHASPHILQTPVRRRVIVANSNPTTVQVAKTVSIPVMETTGQHMGEEEDAGGSVSHSCESINVTDD